MIGLDQPDVNFIKELRCFGLNAGGWGLSTGVLRILWVRCDKERGHAGASKVCY